MKIISFAVPCFNSADYMEKCVYSLLPLGDDIEIILVDDGSTKDNTAEICDRLVAEHPNVIRAIHQENAGHGGAVNAGLAFISRWSIPTIGWTKKPWRPSWPSSVRRQILPSRPIW